MTDAGSTGAQLQEWTIQPFTFRATRTDAMRIKAAMETAVNALTDPSEENAHALFSFAAAIVVSRAAREREAA